MNLWIAILCVAAGALSLLLVLRGRGTPLQRISGAALQCAIWALVWMLWQPPMLLPPKKSAGLDTILPAAAPGTMATPGLAPAAVAALDAVTVDGDALQRDALRDLPPARLHLADRSAAADSRGDWSVDWPRQIQLGDTLSLALDLAPKPGVGDSSVRLTLEDPFGGAVDSALITAAEENARILLHDTPKLSGHWLYHLRVESESGEGATVRREPLPVVVRAPQPPTVLLWLARPGFETAALSRWLRQSGVKTRVITQLAPQIVRRETFNGLQNGVQESVQEGVQKGVKKAASNPLDPASPFDLLILDSHLWPQLTATQRQQLTAASAGKSLLWLVGADSPRAFLDYAREQGMTLARTDITAMNARTGDTPPLLSTGYRPVQAAPGDLQVGADGSALYWAGTRPGRALGFVLFDHSYRWITAGFAPEFARLWKTIFDRQLHYRGGRAPVAVQSPLPRAEQRVTLCSAAFDRAGPQPIAPADGGTPLPGAAAADSAAGACTSYWPQRAGWYHLQGADTDFAFYVFPHDAWPDWQHRMARAGTRQMATARLGPAEEWPAPRRPLPLHWIALALGALLALTWWRERRSLR